MSSGNHEPESSELHQPPPSETPEPRLFATARRSPWSGWAVAGLIAATFVVYVLRPEGVTPAPANPAAPKTFVLVGNITVTEQVRSPTDTDGEVCETNPDSGYDDVHVGTQVVVEDASGKTLGVGTLDAGVLRAGQRCEFAFSVTDLPEQDGFYGVTISHRGTQRYTLAQMKESLALTLR